MVPPLVPGLAIVTTSRSAATEGKYFSFFLQFLSHHNIAPHLSLYLVSLTIFPRKDCDLEMKELIRFRNSQQSTPVWLH